MECYLLLVQKIVYNTVAFFDSQIKLVGMKTFGDILNKSSRKLTALLGESLKSERINKLFYHIISEVDQSFAQNCQFVVLKGNKLTVVLKSAKWATKIRYQAEKILAELKKHREFKDLEKISFMVDRVHDQLTVSKISKEPLSPQNARLWRETLERLRAKLLQ
jgi:hypothetical protein